MSVGGVTNAIIAAGGRASRFGCRSPKSMLTVNNVPLIIYTVKSILNAGITRVIVCLNRPEWRREMARSLENIPEIEMVVDKGCPSTFLLAREVAPLVGHRFLFAYGHAPRPVDHISQVLESNKPIAATCVRRSSKVRTIPWGGNHFLEPPYLLDSYDLDKGDFYEWDEFFLYHRKDLRTVPVIGPHEFNFQREFKSYRKYVLTMVY